MNLTTMGRFFSSLKPPTRCVVVEAVMATGVVYIYVVAAVFIELFTTNNIITLKKLSDKKF